MKLNFYTLPAILLFSLTLGELAVAQQPSLVGSWDAEIESPGGKLRFGLTIQKSTDPSSELTGYLHNGSERIKIPVVTLRDGELKLGITHYDSELVYQWDNASKTLSGTWKRRRGVNEWVEMRTSAVPSNRNPRSKKREFGNFPGTWAVSFAKSKDPAVAIFKANNKTGHIDGTFLTTTGDYRYLDGVIVDGALELSCFDGAHAFLFRCKKKSADSLEGMFWSSNTWQESWTAQRDNNAQLPDAFQQTIADKNSDLGNFSFPDLTGKARKLNDPEFSGKARIIYVFGSWCPNCHDAGKYFAELKDWYGDDLHILGLAFELTGEFERDSNQVKKYLARHECDYPVLIAGLSDKAAASRALPFLDKIRSYPTTIFLNSSGEIQAVHTGFTGPATGKAYSNQKKKFETLLDRIIAEAKKRP